MGIPLTRCWLALLLLITVTACGGGGGGGSTPTTSPPVADGGGDSGNDNGAGDGDNSGDNGDDNNSGGDPSADEDPAQRTIHAASRLASRTTFGADLATIEFIDAVGADAWIESQFDAPITFHDGVVTDLLQRLESGEFDELVERENNDLFFALFGRMAWWHTTVTASDQLRQRVAYALSQIFVISDEVNTLFIAPYATSNYYDMLLTHAFGNYRDLLRAVTLHPSMGIYLSHLNNAKSNPEAGTFPDENYAREVMQLFSIGLFELNADGSELIGSNGQPVPTYDNTDIGEFAKIFTGLSWAAQGADNRFGGERYNFQQPMEMYEEFHEPGEKFLLNGLVVPAGQSGIEDIDAAIDNLFNHPNVGPFIGRQLIQRLVTSNPSPEYISRVSAAFADNGDGVRGDMRAVLRAVLLDAEALAEPDGSSSFGKLREPLLRYTAMLRQLGVASPDGFYANLGFFVQQSIQQHPLSAPSVFNFYLPNHQPIGEIADLGLVAPEFQITNTNTVVQISNLMQAAVVGDFVNDIRDAPFGIATLEFDDFLALADDLDALMERLDTVFTYGTLSADTRDAIRELLALIDEPDLRVRVGAYLVLISPDYAVEI